MHPEYSIIEGNYLQDILQQPQALAETFDSLRMSPSLAKLVKDVCKKKFERIVLTGMGSSFHALHPLNLTLVGQGLTPVKVETSELVHYKRRFFDPRTLVIAVSQSGRSAEIIRLLQVNRNRSVVIGVTNTPDSPLAKRADAAVLTKAGQEFSVSCKTYVTALMALSWLGDLFCGRDAKRAGADLKRAAPAVAAYLSSWKSHVECLTQMLAGIRHLFLVGRGNSLAAVGTGALIIKEADHFHAEGMSSAAFRHGPLEMLSEEIFVLVFAGDARTTKLNRRLLQDILDQKGKAALVEQKSACLPFRISASSTGVRSMLEILVVQMITLALAARMGREPGRFELASKVTTTE
jgi:glucosamine--fructose-6-phosphate aminotransferase (isomerizing)